MADDTFQLYELTVTVTDVSEQCTCNMKVGDSLSVNGCKLYVNGSSGFCLYAVQSVMPLLPAKQRQSHPADWMESDEYARCPGDLCGLRMKIERAAQREFRHDEVSEVKWNDKVNKN